jgi:hypothetical protein
MKSSSLWPERIKSVSNLTVFGIGAALIIYGLVKKDWNTLDKGLLFFILGYVSR